jgi:hypothetical protein
MMSRAQHHVDQATTDAECQCGDTISMQEVKVELHMLVEQGLLHMGVSPDGESIFWPTERGIQELGMEAELDSIPS